MYAIYGNIYHQYTPNVSIYTIHGSYGYYYHYTIIIIILNRDLLKHWLHLHRQGTVQPAAFGFPPATISSTGPEMVGGVNICTRTRWS